MENNAVWLTGPGRPPTVGTALVPEPSENELLIQVKAVACQPGEWKIQAGLIPIYLDYPAIIGVSLSGEVEKVGPGVTRFRPGDRVACNSTGPLRNNPRYGAYQRYCLVPQSLTSKIHETPYEQAAATSTAYGAFSALFIHLGLDRLNLDSSPIDKGERVLIWGISSSFGSAASRIAAKAGYTVIGVASAQHADLATDSGAAHFADRKADSVVDTVASLGPFKAVLAAADSAEDQLKIGAILQRQGGGRFLSTMGVRAGVELPAGVEGFFRQFLDDYLDAGNSEFAEWVWWECFEDAFEKGWLKPVPLKVVGGLSRVTRAWDSLQNGEVSGKRLIIRPDLD